MLVIEGSSGNGVGCQLRGNAATDDIALPHRGRTSVKMGAMAITQPASDPGPDREGAPTEHAHLGAAAGGVEAEYSIDDLAAITGVPSRTIRFYQSKRLLAAPERRGRVAVYGEDHADRLRTISELQERGLRLDAIRDVLEQVSGGGDSLQAWLGVGDRLQSAWTDDRPIVVTHDELLARVGEHRPAMINELDRAGLARRQGNSRPATYLVRSPGLLELALKLERSGVDLATAEGAERILRARIAKASSELVGYFGERLGKGFGEASDATSVADSFDSVRPLSVEAVQLIFAQEMERSLRGFVESGGVVAGVRRVQEERERALRDERKEAEKEAAKAAKAKAKSSDP